MTPDAEDAAPYCVDYCHGMVGGPAVIGPTGIIGFMQGPENDRKAEELCKRLNAAWKELGPTIIFLRKKREDAEQAIDAATKPLHAKIDAAKNLLAVLHRDGGHHTDAVGFIQSCKDGEQVRHALIQRADQAEARNRALVETLKEYENKLK